MGEAQRSDLQLGQLGSAHRGPSRITAALG